MLHLERIEPDNAVWREMDALPDRTVFQTPEWLAFIARTQRAEPVVAAVQDDGATVGYFTGLVGKRMGLRLLGSPGPGWSTWYMGFNLHKDVSRQAALQALLPFAFKELGCQHLELGDREMALADCELPGVHGQLKRRSEVDLRPSEDDIFAGMTSACRRAIRKAVKSGVVIEEAADATFADDYYDQLIDVFAKQGRTPNHDRERVRALVDEVHPSGRVLLLRARDAEGRCIATGIFPGMGRSAYFWGGASWRQHQDVRPNEAIMWYALRHWKARGAEACDLGGIADYPYKRKYGGTEVRTPFVSASKYRALPYARDLALQLVRKRRRAIRRLHDLRNR
jgi:hypothetical protein